MNEGGFRISIFASLNNIDVDRMLKRKLLLPPIGVQWKSRAQQCMSLERVKRELVIRALAKSKFVVVDNIQRLVKLTSPVTIKV